MHKMLIKKIIETGDTEEMKSLEDIMIQMIDDIKIYNREEYKHIEHKLYKMVYGDHLNEELAHEWVDNMQNKDGSKGQHWTVEQTSQYAGSYNKWDFYSVCNMIWSDYFDPKYDTQFYMNMARDWCGDKDIPEGKTLRYYFYVVC